MIINGDENAPWAIGFEAPDDGDDEDAASVDVGLECLANRTAYLKALRHPATGIERWLTIPEPLHSPVRVEIGEEVGDVVWNSPWREDVAGTTTVTGWRNAYIPEVPVAQALSFMLELPHGCVLKGLNAHLTGADGSGSMPSSRPKLQLFAWTPGLAVGTTVAPLATFTDTSLTRADYELPHSIGGNVNVTIDRGASLYRVRFTSEGGSNSNPGLILHGVKVRFDMTHMDGAAS